MDNMHICKCTINAERYTGFETIYVAMQATSFSEPSLLISARQCQAIFCTCCNSLLRSKRVWGGWVVSSFWICGHQHLDWLSSDGGADLVGASPWAVVAVAAM
ncbi:hypothetical protein ATANTOWER_017467 [Ataeniobius toweri]|uniref:Yippee domain-containing protein n=1 Tax=Ataeniobius toweri TaxID=208326 RepID=A0ABU7CF67_9TELE|nr:hypothetical protein [Ataeniobius toweri]